ncbi:hypothetical protein L6452_37801 [Arctium lappa]|uniref:Uncharacterized protein n=1 Tax=Arctium lappa TaxID=4217 RepID=A0ACB8Y3B7_ARCLA|nr:hypothetical protein L6452_37801 [Arctium lappa]
MHKKSIARKPRKAWDIISYWRATLNIPDFQMSSEPVSMYREEEHLDYFKSLARVPDEINLVSSEDLRSDEVPRGYCVLYEYPFKISFIWPFSPLVRAFLDAFDLTPGQLMSQFWRIVQVINRLTADWEVPFNVNDLLTAYSVRPDNYHRYSLFPRSKGDNVLIDFTKVKPRRDSHDKIQRILERSITDRSFSPRSNDEEDEAVFVAEVTYVEGSHREGEREEEEEEREEEMTAEQLELAHQRREKARKRSAPSTGVDSRRVRGKPRSSPKKTGDATLSSLSGATPTKGTVAGVELGGSIKATKDALTTGVSGVEKPFAVPSSSSKSEEKNKEKVA